MKISVWYHCIIRGPRIPDEDHAFHLACEQIGAISSSGLAQIAEEIHVGLNGNDEDALMISSVMPNKAKLHINGPEAQSEIATLRLLRQSLEPGMAVLYHHIKGVQFPNNPTWKNWRKCMENVCVWNWPFCVRLLEQGADTVGPHWMSSATCSVIDNSQRYWGGNFWWATSDYLLTLPPLPPDTHENRYEAEVWIGKSPRDPHIVNLARHNPMQGCRP